MYILVIIRNDYCKTYRPRVNATIENFLQPILPMNRPRSVLCLEYINVNTYTNKIVLFVKLSLYISNITHAVICTRLQHACKVVVPAKMSTMIMSKHAIVT